MRKDLGVYPAVFPMPVLMIATYCEDGSVDVMNAAWGTVCSMDKVALCISGHQTNKNIDRTKAFTVAIADAAHMAEADFFGIASAEKMKDKFARTGLTAVKSNWVNAPVIEEFPLTMECEYVETVNTEGVQCVVGRIINVTAHDYVLNERGKVDATKLDAILFDQFGNKYFRIGEEAGGAWKAGVPLMKGEQA